MKLAKRVEELPPYLFAQISKKIAAKRAEGVDVITFGSVLETVGPGGMFGEMALIDDGPRSAAALANEATEASAIDKTMFVQLVREEPEFALHVMRLLTERIRRIAQNR